MFDIISTVLTDDDIITGEIISGGGGYVQIGG